jgi:hypothetical protein
MKIINATILLAALAGAMGSAPVLARDGHGHFAGSHHRFHQGHRFHHGHHHARFGFFIGAPLLLAPWYYGPQYYPPAVVMPSSPPVYIDQGQAAQDSQYWYYCRESETYYPYVKQCAGPWQRVVPQPPPS